MSLAPGEQRALARIEDGLRRSDPRLAAMLATFTLPVTRRMIVHVTRLFWYRRWVTLAAIALAVVCVIALARFLPGHPSLTACPAGMHAPGAGLPTDCQRSGRSAPPPLSGPPWPQRRAKSGRRAMAGTHPR